MTLYTIVLYFKMEYCQLELLCCILLGQGHSSHICWSFLACHIYKITEQFNQDSCWWHLLFKTNTINQQFIAPVKVKVKATAAIYFKHSAGENLEDIEPVET